MTPKLLPVVLTVTATVAPPPLCEPDMTRLECELTIQLNRALIREDIEAISRRSEQESFARRLNLEQRATERERLGRKACEDAQSMPDWVIPVVAGMGVVAVGFAVAHTIDAFTR